MAITLIHQNVKSKGITENDSFNGCNDLFLGDTREINPKYLGAKKTKKGFSEIIEYGYLYVLNARGTDLYKIGISGNFNRRFRDISAGSPLPVLHCFSILISNPHISESFLHNYFKESYFKNDWFSLNQNQLKELSDFIVKFKYGCSEG